MTKQIVKAGSAELTEVAQLFNRYRQFYKMSSDLDAAKKFISDRLSLRDSIIFLSIESGKPQGFAQLYPSFSSVAMRRIWTLNDLFVNSEDRRAGVAHRLLEHILEQAREENIFSVKLVTAKDNFIAKSLYDSFGFQLNTKFDSYSLRP